MHVRSSGSTCIFDGGPRPGQTRAYRKTKVCSPTAFTTWHLASGQRRGVDSYICASERGGCVTTRTQRSIPLIRCFVLANPDVALALFLFLPSVLPSDDHIFATYLWDSRRRNVRGHKWKQIGFDQWRSKADESG